MTLNLPGVVSTVIAQERVERPWSLRSLFFPGRKVSRRSFEQPDAPQLKRKQPARKKRQKPTVKRVVEPEIAISEKASDAKIVLVVGDFVAGAAAEGLNALFATSANVKIIDRTNGSSGLVRDDHYDWTSRIGDLIEAEKPAAIVMVIGANDRQQMRIGERREPLRSEPWTNEYVARATTFASFAAQSDVPLVWVGVPAFKSAKTTSDMLAFNELYRKVAADAGGEFIDVWEGFVDENGAFVSTGPDVAGQSVRLRADDGINFTAAGKRKLAFYSEKHLRKLLGETDASTAIARTENGVLPEMLDPKLLLNTDRTPPMPLDDPALDGGAELLGASIAPGSIGPAGGQRLLEKLTPVPVAGRADDFSGGRTATAAAGTTPPGESQATSAAIPAVSSPATAN